MKHLLWLFAALLLCACSRDEEPEQPADSFLGEENAEYIAVLGDLQQYGCVGVNKPYLEQTVDWLRAFSAAHPGKLRAIIQTGDVTENNHPIQWDFINEICGPLAEECPFVYSTGNHDYDWRDPSLDITDKHSALTSRFPLRQPALAAMVAQFEEGRPENAMFRITIGDEPLLLLMLEFAPRIEVCAWARTLIAEHPDERVLLMTHEFLRASGKIDSDGKYSKIQIADANYLSPAQIWDRLISPNDNVRAVLCGHNGRHAFRSTRNSAGRAIPQLLFNLQYYPNGGNGNVMMLRTVDGRNFSSAVFSTITLLIENGSVRNFVI